MRRHPDLKTARLRQLPLVGDASTRDLQDLARAGDLVTVDEGRRLHTAGRRPTEAFLVVDGAVELVADGVVIATAGPGELVGIPEVLDGEPADVDAIAASPSTLLAVPVPRFRALIETNHAVRAATVRQLSAHARRFERFVRQAA